MQFGAMDRLPDDARLWVYGFRDPLDNANREIVQERLNAFVAEWLTHGADVQGAWAFVEDRFVVVAGHNPTGVSGCSIDSSVHNFKWLRDGYNLNALDRNLIFFRDGDGGVTSLDRASFQAEIDAGRVGTDTVVFDTTIQKLGDLQAGRFEVPLADGWHARAFKLRSTSL